MMSIEPWTKADLRRFAKRVVKIGGLRAYARQHPHSFGYYQARYAEAVRRGLAEPLQRVGRAKPKEDKPVSGGAVRARQTITEPVPTKGVRRYLLTCAQNNTDVHQAVWKSMRRLALEYNAQILVSRFTYNHNAFGQMAVKPGTRKAQAALWYDPAIADYVRDERVELAPGLVWCGEMNILPTAVRPLQGLESYTGRKSGIFPHVKVAMDSIPSGKHEPTKFNYTTGTVTQRNYIQKKAGMKAEFHHCYGALLVEVTAGGWWCRQVLADSEGRLQDLTTAVDGDTVSCKNVEGIVWGDIHHASIDHSIRDQMPGMVTSLQPKHIFYHDLLDFVSRNVHMLRNRDWHALYRVHLRKQDSVAVEVNDARWFIKAAQVYAPVASHVIVNSNHDDFLLRWLASAKWQQDPLNARYYLRLQARVYAAISDDPYKPVNVMRLALGHEFDASTFILTEDESYILCPDANGGIECGMHGHRGPNGTRGSAAAFARMGRKACIGHMHSASIHDGVYVAGTSSKLHLDYNSGPSSWSHSHVVVYPNGKRAIITMWNGKWRA